jgi:predicted acyltransferase (DUF342 family)
MTVPDYVPIADVQSACRELGLSDWSRLTSPEISLEEAKKVQEVIGVEASLISTEQFRAGLEVELEHGLQFSDANVTNNHPLLTGKIVLAHLKEMLDYYQRLEVAELEGDMLKARRAGNEQKLAKLYARLLVARRELAESEAAALT